MFFTKDGKKFVRPVAVLIVRFFQKSEVQGLTWFALSLAGIVVKSAPPDKLTETGFRDHTKYSEYLSKIIYQNFLKSDTTARSETKVIRPQDFDVFLWIYAILSAIWVAATLDLHFAIKARKPRQTYNTLVVGITVLLTSVIDLVFFALLARDFSTCPFNLGAVSTEATPTSITLTSLEPSSTALTSTTTVAREESTVQMYLSSGGNVATSTDCQVASGIVMTLAARGYVLWLVNVVVAINLVLIGAKALRTSKFLTYNSNTIPRAQISDFSQRKASSPSNDFYNGNGRYSPPGRGKGGKSYVGTPVALNNRNPNGYF